MQTTAPALLFFSVSLRKHLHYTEHLDDDLVRCGTRPIDPVANRQRAQLPINLIDREAARRVSIGGDRDKVNVFPVIRIGEGDRGRQCGVLRDRSGVALDIIRTLYAEEVAQIGRNDR